MAHVLIIDPSGSAMSDFPVVLRLENIGDDYHWAKRNGYLTERLVHHHYQRMGGDKDDSSVCQMAWDGELVRLFPVRGTKDYSQANSVGSRGVFTIYLLKPGIYQIHELISWKRARLWWAKVANGQLTEIKLEEALQCLSIPSA